MQESLLKNVKSFSLVNMVYYVDEVEVSEDEFSQIVNDLFDDLDEKTSNFKITVEY